MWNNEVLGEASVSGVYFLWGKPFPATAERAMPSVSVKACRVERRTICLTEGDVQAGVYRGVVWPWLVDN